MKFNRFPNILYLIALNLSKWNFGSSSNIRNKSKENNINQNIWLKCKLLLCAIYPFAYSFSFFGLIKDDKETTEDKLITTIKRSILCIQRGEYDTAEQILHMALRIAQDIQNKNGITYVYDVMANLALERGQFDKAEVLFVDVMRRLLSDGVPYDNIKILHISSKLAHIADLKGDIDKAKLGFTWTLAELEKCQKKEPSNIDIRELWALTTNWYGQLLMKENNFKQAKDCFRDAYDCFMRIRGSNNEEVVTILNNLSVACTNMEDLDEAIYYILEALGVIKNVKDKSQEGVLLANLGLIYLRKGLMREAETYCSQGWKTGKAQQNKAAIDQAEYCLNEIKMLSL